MIKRGAGSDFVLGMSLAEIFLLLFFTVFLASAGEVEGGGSDPTVEIRVLKEKNEKLRTENVRQRDSIIRLARELQSLKDLVQHLRTMVGANGTSRREFDRAIERLKRGFAKCSDDNTLIKVVARAGTLEVSILVADTGLGRFVARQGGRLRVGDVLTNRSVIDAFLRTVRQYGDRPDLECRFDYILWYDDDADYRNAREDMERYLYPARDGLRPLDEVR